MSLLCVYVLCACVGEGEGGGGAVKRGGTWAC